MGVPADLVPPARRSDRGWAGSARRPPRCSACPTASRSSPASTTGRRRCWGRACSTPAMPSTRAGRPAGSGSMPTGPSPSTACSSPRRRCPAAGSWAGRWPRWARRSTGCGRVVLGDRWSADELFRAADGVAPGADGLVLLPYLAGERAPIFDEGARGALVGLTLAHGPEHIARAALEAAAFSLRHVAEPLAAAGAPIRELRLAGRPAPNDAWARIKASVLGRPGGDPGRGRDRGDGRRDPRGGRASGRSPRSRPGSTAMPAIARRVEPDRSARGRVRRGVRDLSCAVPCARRAHMTRRCRSPHPRAATTSTP